ncbi:precorrin-6A synthase (deacetylating) [Paracoccus sp. (in: a-proteobacteria)]|uniref:precorrin-6A synthase (deacetylating) n=1 Tax=Paracoccus sp. TaxID=267 RepID=UPI00321FDBCA
METEIWLIGIGTGNVEHLTLQAVRALNRVDLVLVPRKGAEKSALADLRRTICAELLTTPGIVTAEFDLPRRDGDAPDYLAGVLDWHDAIAEAWKAAIEAHPGARRVAILVWGDPSLYDSSLRIAERLRPWRKVALHVVPGIMSPQVLAAAHRIPLNELGAPFQVTTGRCLREQGWPQGVDTLVVMLDGGCAFTTLDPKGVSIWWGACLGMPEQIIDSGPLAEAGPRILAARQAARARLGWIMDIYLLRRSPGA